MFYNFNGLSECASKYKLTHESLFTAIKKTTQRVHNDHNTINICLANKMHFAFLMILLQQLAEHLLVFSGIINFFTDFLLILSYDEICGQTGFRQEVNKIQLKASFLHSNEYE